jgi:histidine triad (HIT) family protein
MNRINTNCLFCRIVRRELDHVPVLEDAQVLAIMDLYPATPGHVLVLPKQHIETLYEMPVDVGAQLMTTAIMVAKAIREKLSPVGLNLVQSNGVAAGQVIPHFHLHLVPRYNGDPVSLRFGHENRPERVGELERIASLLKSGIRPESMGVG